MDGEEKNIGPFRRTSARTRRIATRMASALASSDNRAQAALARLEALENDNAGVEVVDLNDDEYGSTDEKDPGQFLSQLSSYQCQKDNVDTVCRDLMRSPHAKKAVQDYETQDKARESFGEEGSKIIHGCLTRTNLESLPPHVPTYLRAAVGPPSTSSRRHYCSVCGSSANYTCVRCGTRFCSCRCQVIHNDTRCLKFVA